MSILGNVETGWFATLAHGCQSLCQGSLNLVSGSGRWGDKFYGTMERVAVEHIEQISNNAVTTAKAAGATDIGALQSANQTLEGIANPHSLSEFGGLLQSGLTITRDTIVQSVQTTPDLLGALMPIIIGAGVLGTLYVCLDGQHRQTA